jgi:hypothetical protein
MFGAPRFTEAQREEVNRTLDSVLAFRRSSKQEIQEGEVEVPDVFKKSPQIIRFALISYFRQLPYGEREAILADFKTAGLSEEQAFKKFFEVTGNEKLGQYLSFRRDLIPENYREHLKEFQENVKPSDFSEVRRTIEDQLGGPLEKFFQRVNEAPLKILTGLQRNPKRSRFSFSSLTTI